MAWLNGWAEKQRIQLDIDNTKIDGALTNFPIMVRLSNSSGISNEDLTQVFDVLGSDANRLKIAVTEDDEVTECKVEIEYWDYASEIAILHVKAPSVASGADTTLYLYYDSGQADNTTNVGDIGDAPAQAVWDSDFEVVYHMAQDPSGGADCILDSTSNVNHGTPGGTMLTEDLVAGLNGARGIDFDGTDDVVGLKTNYGALTDYCFEVLGKFDDLSTRRCLYGNYEDADDSWMFGFHPTDGLYVYAEAGGANTISFSKGATTGLGTSNYHYMATKRTGSDIAICLDDDQTYQTGTDNSTLEALTTNPGVAKNMPLSTTYEEFDGIIGEVRVSSANRTDAWATATYHSLFDSLITLTDEFPPASAVIPMAMHHYTKNIGV